MQAAGPRADSHLQSALRHAAGLLASDPPGAERRAKDILAGHPDAVTAQRILGAAYRLQGNPQQGLALLEPLLPANAGSADFLHELGCCLGAVGRGDEAIGHLRKAVELQPGHAGAWKTLGDQLGAAGQELDSRDAYQQHLKATTRHPELVDAAEFLRKKQLANAEPIVRAVLAKDPVDVIAIRMLAEIGISVGQLEGAQNLLQRCLELAPDFHLARQAYATVLMRRHDLQGSLREIDRLLAAEPLNPSHLLFKGTVLVRKGDHVPALAIYEQVLKNYPRQAAAHMYYGHTLKTVGRVEDAVIAYRKAIELSPGIGEAYWSLANLKTFRFSDDDIAAMRQEFQPDTGDPDDQGHLAFALGKAYEDRGEFDESFSFYEKGNAIRGKKHRYSTKRNIFDTARQIKTLDREFFAARVNVGCSAPDPIFIVGLPRAGSTLLEQILASHSLVEGTSELPDIIALARRLGGDTRKNPASLYPEKLAELTPRQFRDLGESYIETTRVQRSDTPYFIDKMPNNFQHIGLIHLILPNARIIDARRHPMAGCFSCFKQLFARGQTFTYSLTDVGHYYRDYVKLMDHWDTVLPGRVLRVQYEEMVADTEAQIRRLLGYCGLEFEEQCLRFYETERAVRTPSSEQVRQPVYRQGLEQWRNFEGHLDPLKKALGPLLERYPLH